MPCPARAMPSEKEEDEVNKTAEADRPKHRARQRERVRGGSPARAIARGDYYMKKVKEIFLRYSDYYVLGLALVCVYAILQIKFDFAFWIGSSERADVINEVIANISYSYLAGYFFYLLTVVLPHQKMKNKVNEALTKKLGTIVSNYKACAESVYPILQSMKPEVSKEELVEAFKAVSYFQPCRLQAVGVNVTVAEYIKAKHQENVKLATELLEYKPWLSSETIAKVEEIRNSNMVSIILGLTQPNFRAQMDNEDSRKMLAEQVYDLWQHAKSISA